MEIDSLRTSLSPSASRTLDALSGRHRLSQSPSRRSASVFASSHEVVTKRSSYGVHSDIEDRAIRHRSLLTDSDDSSFTQLSRTLTGTHGDVTPTGNDALPQKVKVMYEARNKELREELEKEINTRIRAEKQRADLKAELSVTVERLEAAIISNQHQSEVTRKREADIQRLQQENDESTAQHDIQIAAIRRKHQEAINQLTEQIEKVHSNKQRSDREKIQLQAEGDELASQLEQMTKAKLAAEKSARQLEGELAQRNKKLADVDRELRDVTAQRNRFQQELSESTSRIGDLQNQLEKAKVAKATLSKQLDEAKRLDDGESSARARLIKENYALQQLVEQTKEQMNEEHDARVEIHKKLTQALNDASNWRQKFESSEGVVPSDAHEVKKQLAVRLTDCESKLGNSLAKGNALEKVNSKLQEETETLVAELDKYQTLSVQQEKRLRQNEKVMDEWQTKINELTTKLEKSLAETRQHFVEINQHKEQLEDAREINNSLRREIKTLSEDSRDVKEQLRQSKLSVSELQKTSRQFEAERDSLQGTVEAMESALQQKETKLERALLDVVAINQEMDKRLAEKDEELQSLRKSQARALDIIQASLDAEAKGKMEAVLVKKRLEQDISELELTLDSVNIARAEAEKNLKQCQQELTDLEDLLDEEQRMKRTNRVECTLVERKNTALTTELQDLRLQNELLDKTRKIVEDELYQASERISELSAANSTLTLTKKKLETDLHNLSNELSELASELKLSNEQLKKALGDTTRLTEELNQHEQNHVQTEKQRRALEFQNKELQTRIEELETHNIHGSQKTIEKLQQQVHELESELAGEQRRHGETQKTMRRHERRLAELTEHIDNDAKNKQVDQDLFEKVQTKVKQYKRQLDEAEEMASVNLAKYRMLLHSLEEAEARAKIAEKALDQQRAINLNRSSTLVEESVTQPHPGVTLRKTTTTRTHTFSSEAKAEQ